MSRLAETNIKPPDCVQIVVENNTAVHIGSQHVYRSTLCDTDHEDDRLFLESVIDLGVLRRCLYPRHRPALMVGVRKISGVAQATCTRSGWHDTLKDPAALIA